MNMLVLRNVSKSYDTPSGEGRTTVLKDISLSVAEREAVAIVGPSGSGKSTLLNICGALDRPSSGTVSFAGTDLAGLKDQELARIRNEDIGFVFQLHHLLPQCTVLENVLVPTVPFHARHDDGEIRARAEALLAKVGLERHLDYFPAQLSGGELQRVAVVRALINKPKLVLADEPTGSLDHVSAENLGRLLVRLNKDEGLTLVVVTHSAALAALLDRTLRLKDGLLEEDLIR